MDFEQLRSFIVLAKTLNFGRAARQLYLSQSALSIRLQNLEAYLGAPLLERNRRTVRLTPAGASLLEEGEDLLRQVAGVELRTRRIGSGESGHLRVGFVASATAQLIPRVVIAFRKKYPGVTLELKNLSTAEQVDALKAGTIDCGFVRMPLVIEGLIVGKIHKEPFSLVLPKTHPLAADETITAKTLADEPFIAYGRKWAPMFYEHWTGICRHAGYTPNIVQEVGEMTTALVLVAAGMGVAILPTDIAKGHRSGLKVIPLVRDRIQSEIGVAVLATRSSPLTHNLVKTAKEVTHRLPSKVD